jgi:hypothetical protein
MCSSIRSLLIAAGLAAALVSPVLAGDPTTAITYQGFLRTGTNPVTSPVDMTFQLFDAPAGGNPLSGLIAQTITPQAGVLSTALDFGISPYLQATTMYLEVTVEGELLGRQLITPATFALNTRGIEVATDGLVSVEGGQVGLRAYSTVGDGYALVAENLAPGTGTNLGVAGIVSSGGWSAGVAGYNYATNGSAYGGYFSSLEASESVGVYGTGQSLGGLFETSQGTGVIGRASGDFGRGLSGENTSFTGNTFGVYGAVSSPNGYAGYFTGGRNFFQGRVGIRQADPAHDLHINGDLLIENGGHPVLTVRSDRRIGINSPGFPGWSCIVRQVLNDVYPFFVEDTNQESLFHVDNTGTIEARGGANVGQALNVGTTARFQGQTFVGSGGFSNVALNVNLPLDFGINLQTGDAGKPGGGSWANTSDERLKKNIAPIDGALDTLLALRGVHFEYIDPAAIGELPGVRTGFIAQQVEGVLPDWVWDAQDGYKRMTIRGFEALAVEALRELDAQQAAIEAEQEALRTERDQLRAETAALRAETAAMAARLERLERAMLQAGASK